MRVATIARSAVLIQIALSVFFMSQQAFAQEKVDHLDSVVVLSQRIGIPLNKQNRNIQIIDVEEIKKMPVNNLNDVLALAAGVDIRQKGPGGTQADIGIDGGTFDQTLVLINGVKMSDPQTGHNMLNLPIPFEAIERIEILKGPAAGIYGVNAMAGAINIVTKSGADLGTQFRVLAGSNFQKDDSTKKTYSNYGLQTLTGFRFLNMEHLIAAGFDIGNGYRYNSAYQNTKVIYTIQGQFNEKVGMELMAGVAEHDFGANSFYAAPGDRESEELTRNAFASIKVPLRLSERWQMKPYLSFRYGYDDYIFVRQDPSIFRNQHHTYTLDGGLDHTLYTRLGTLGLGLAWRNEQINSTNLGDRSRSNIGGSAAWRKSWQNMDIHGSLFLNYNSVFGAKLYPSLDFGYQIDDAFRVFVNAGSGQRLPTFTDLYYVGPSNLGNDQLKPETLTTLELGLKHNDEGWSSQVSLMYKYGSDFIDWVRSDTTQPWQVMNFTTLTTLGFHADVQKNFRLLEQATIHAYTGYTYLYPTVGAPSTTGSSGLISRYAINSLQHQWVSRLSATLWQRLDLALSNRLIYRYNAEHTEGHPRRSAYDLLDLRVGYRIGDFTVGLDVHNLLDVSYIESGVVPLPGRWLTFSLRMKI